MASAQPGAKECERTTCTRNEKYLNKEQCLDKKKKPDSNNFICVQADQLSGSEPDKELE